MAPNIFDPRFEEGRRPPGFRSRRARIGYELGSEQVGLSLFELPPGEAAYPYHFHYADEEVVIVLEGRPTLRDPDGLRTLEPGEAVRFPLGAEGAHQMRNDTTERVRFLALSSSGRPDVVEYPDSGKIGVGERLPRGGGLRAFFPADAAVGYWHDEPPRDGDEPSSDA
ncbi:MAG TPA: cupin domain-containing protein [Conexibacter sp.]|nr:cupin domain-containing protein [Conexibacter sp.]